MVRPVVPNRKPSAGAESAPKPRKEVDDMEMRTFTSAMRRDLWRELNVFCARQDCTIQQAINRAVFSFLTAEHHTITVPLDED